MNEMSSIISLMFSSLVNQALVNRKNRWQPLPQDQQEALNKILDAIHDIEENRNKIQSQYQQQALETIALKIASEMNMPIGGLHQ